MTSKNHLIYGAITGLLMIVITVISYLAGFIQQDWAQYAPLIIILAGVILSCTNYAKQNQGDVTFGSIFSNGFKTVAIITLIFVVFALVFITIFPSIKEQAMQNIALEMQNHGQSAEQIAAAQGKYTVVMIGKLLYGILSFGIVASLIGALIARKKRNTQAPKL
jgi:hypothetical protein